MATPTMTGTGIGPVDERSRVGRHGRISGIDAARGVALLGMMATHLFPILDDDGTPSVAWSLFAGRSAALFVFLAGVGLALTTGGANAVRPGERSIAATSVATRAAVVTLMGFLLGHLVDDTFVILAYYGVLFLLAVPFLVLSPRVLAGAALTIAVVAPVVMQWSRDFLPEPTLVNPSFASLDQPLTLLTELLLTGVYPAVPLLAYVCGGLAVGRLVTVAASDPTRLKIFSTRLLAGGLLLALAAWIASGILLNEIGGLDNIRAASPDLDEEAITDILWWGPDPTLPTTTWWWLAIRAPHSSTPIDLLHTLGTSMAALAAMLLVARSATWWLRPVVAAGAMTLTLYSLHVLVTEAGLFREQPAMAFLVQAGGALALAVLWRERIGQGPLEKAVAVAAREAKESIAPVPHRETAGRGAS